MNNEKTLTREQTKEKALRLLEYRSHSVSELRQKLRLKGGLDEDIDLAIEFCVEYGFLDDEKYAVLLARDLSNLKKFGKNRIKSELIHKGISPDIAEMALSEIEDNEDELLRLAEKKLKGDFGRKNCDKAIRFLLYRGYDLGDIQNAIERLKSDEI